MRFFCLFSFVEDLFIKFVLSLKSREMGLQIKAKASSCRVH